MDHHQQEEDMAWTRMWQERFETELTMLMNEVIEEVPLHVERES